MKKILLYSILLVLPLTGIGQVNFQFPGLTRVEVDTNIHCFFNYDKKTCRLINTACYDIDPQNYFYCDIDSSLTDWVLVAKVKCEPFKDSVYIVYSSGLSDDPGFFLTTSNYKTIGNFACTDFYINSAGTIYTAGHTNSMFDHRKKYAIQKDTVLEVEQPYYYVGLKGKTKKPVTLYKEKTGNVVVATIPKEYELEILLAETTPWEFGKTYFLLARTDFGLVGWIRLSEGDEWGQLMDVLFFAGD